MNKFLKLLWPSAPTFPVSLVLWTSPDRRAYPVPLSNLELFEETALKLDSSGRNVYFSTCAVDPSRVDEFRRGRREDVVGVAGTFADIDIAGPAHKSDALPKSFEEAFTLLDSFEFAPTIVINSGNGLHVWWLFKEPYFFRRGEFEESQKISKKFFERLRKTFGSNNREIDEVSDLSRILRLPGTHNYKDPFNPKTVELLYSEGPRYDREDLKTKILRPPGRPCKQDIELEVETDSEAMVAVIDSLKGHASEEIQLVLSGKPLAKEGNRDNALQRVASIIAYAAQGRGRNLKAEDLTEILRPSVEAMGAAAKSYDNPPPNMDAALDKMRRAIESRSKKRESEKEQEALILKGLLAGGEIQEEEYTEDEIALWAKEQFCSVKEFKRRLIIQKDKSYFVFSDGKYSPPYIKEALWSPIHGLIRFPFVKLIVEKEDKPPKKKTQNEILDEYGTACSYLESDLTAQYSRYDAETDTFIEAVCPIRKDLTPEFNEHIDKWLRLLGGEEADRLLDWIATIDLLTMPSAALLLVGPPGVGKSMLTCGLSRLWGANTPTDLGRIMESFNSDLTRCPLVAADEDIPRSRTRSTTAMLRQEIACDTRTLSRKYLPNSTLKGAVRIVVCTNNISILRMEKGSGEDDNKAVAERFLYIRSSGDAEKFLKNLGGREATKEWVSGDKIARHALWLKANRDVSLGTRFAVEGVESELTKSIPTSSDEGSAVAEWLIKYLSCSTQTVSSIKGIYTGGGCLFVTSSAVEQYWSAMCPTGNPPTINMIGRVLHSFTRGKEVRHKNGYFKRINLEYLMDWMKRCGIGNEEEIQKKLCQEPCPDLKIIMEKYE